MLSRDEALKALQNLPGWELTGNEIRKTFRFADFVHSIGFVGSVALLAERANHHPDIDVRWNTVLLVLSTHSEGGLTGKDLSLAAEINKL